MGSGASHPDPDTTTITTTTTFTTYGGARGRGLLYLALETADQLEGGRKVLGGDVLLQEALKVPVGGQEQQHPAAKGPEGGRSESGTSPSRSTRRQRLHPTQEVTGGTSTCLGSGEESRASLATAGRILSVKPFPPDSMRATPTLSSRSARCWAVHFLTTALKWLCATHRTLRLHLPLIQMCCFFLQILEYRF